jgi:hypothetical protein
MSEVLENTIELPLDTAAKRALIETELRKDAGRSDRKIADVVGHGICHKTVGAARERLGIASPLGNLAPPTAAIVRLGDKCPPPPGVVDEPKYDPFDPKLGDMVIQHQPAIAIYENPFGAIVIRQECTARDDDDPVIIIRPEHVEKLVAKLRQVAKDALS